MGFSLSVPLSDSDWLSDSLSDVLSGSVSDVFSGSFKESDCFVVSDSLTVSLAEADELSGLPTDELSPQAANAAITEAAVSTHKIFFNLSFINSPFIL